MRRTRNCAAHLFSVALFFVAVSTANAQVNPPPWWGAQDPNSSYFCYHFDTATGWTNPEPGFWDPFGPPEFNHNNGWWAPTLGDHEGMVGVVSGQTATIDMMFRNARRPDWTKYCWLQVDFYEAFGSDVSLGLETEPGSNIFNVEETDEDLGGGWFRATVTFQIHPQPSFETLHWQFTGGDPGAGQIEGGAWIDNFCFGTICVVPEPATFGVLGLGALALLRRRRKA